jgi:hypothetical protein
MNDPTWASKRPFEGDEEKQPSKLPSLQHGTGGHIMHEIDRDIPMGSETAHLKHSLSEDECGRKPRGQDRAKLARGSVEPSASGALAEAAASASRGGLLSNIIRSVSSWNSQDRSRAAAGDAEEAEAVVEALSNVASDLSAEEGNNEIRFEGEWEQATRLEREQQAELLRLAHDRRALSMPLPPSFDSDDGASGLLVIPFGALGASFGDTSIIDMEESTQDFDELQRQHGYDDEDL